MKNFVGWMEVVTLVVGLVNLYCGLYVKVVAEKEGQDRRVALLGVLIMCVAMSRFGDHLVLIICYWLIVNGYL